MESFDYNKLFELYGNGSDEIRAKIIDDARMIIANRQRRAPVIQEAKIRIDENARRIKPLIEDIKRLILSITDCDDEGEIVSLCDRINNNIEIYQRNISALHHRVNDGKIRVAAIGYTGVGKSEFHNGYTGLENKAFPRNPANMQDSTGTVVTVQSSYGRGLSYEILLFNENEVLKVINWYIDEIRKQLPGWSANGYAHFHNINDVKKCRGQVVFPDNIQPSLKSGIEHYFCVPQEGDWVDWLINREVQVEGNSLMIQQKPDGRRFITTSDVSIAHKFILISEPCKFFLATKEVRVFADDLRNNDDILSCFEIVDTKGLSTYAGAYVNNEIMDAIQDCDAVFSICKDDQTYINQFHGDVLGSFRGNTVFKKKHFAIINLFDPNNRDINQPIAIRQLENQNTSNKAYLGSALKDKDFANYVIVDMLASITEVVTMLDKERIRKCNNSVNKINTDITHLRSLVDRINLEEFNEDSVVRKKVEELFNLATDTITTFAQKKQVGKGADITEAMIASKVYAIIVGSEDNIAQPKINNVEQAINIAVESRYKSMGLEKGGRTENTIGSFIQDTAIKFNDVVCKPLYELSLQQTCVDPLKRELLDEIWQDLMLDKIFDSDNYNWGIEEVAHINPFFEHLSNIYTTEAGIGTHEVPRMFSSYTILYNYFSNPNVDIEPNDDKFMSVNHKHLKETLKEAFINCNIGSIIESIEIDKGEIPLQASNLIRDAFKMGYIDMCMSFYKNYTYVILDETERERIKQHSLMKEIHSIMSEVQKISIGIIPE